MNFGKKIFFDISPIRNRKSFIYLLTFFIVLIGFGPFFVFLPATIGLDWDYFNAYSLLIRSEVIHYHSFPLHDPWMGGGLDLLTNGQNRIFSPLLLLNILIEPVLANICTLLFYSFLGAWGCIKLAQKWKWDVSSSILFVSAFSWCSWFSLHFSEGHIPFAGFQMLPCLQYLILTQAESIRKRCLLGLLFFFLMAEGQVYPFIFFILYAVVWIISSQNKKEWVQNPAQWLLPIVSVAFIVIARAIPTLKNPIKRELIFDSYSYTFSDALQAFFSPNQSVLISLGDESQWRFHEYGCYLGLLLSTLFLTGIFYFKKKKLPAIAKPMVIVALFWFWVGTGLGSNFNPWTLFQRIPVLNRLHIQSRTLILFFFPFLTLAILGWQAIKTKLSKRWQYFLIIILLSEFLMIRFGTFYETLQAQGKSGPENAVILSERLEQTEPYGQKYQFYLSNPNHACVTTYEPSAPGTRVKAYGQPGYRGEIFSDSQDSNVAITSYTPGKITIDYKLKNIEKITLNTNFLQGWVATSLSSPGSITSSADGLLEWMPSEKSGSAIFQYHPPYLTLVSILTILGWILIIGGSLFTGDKRLKNV